MELEISKSLNKQVKLAHGRYNAIFESDNDKKKELANKNKEKGLLISRIHDLETQKCYNKNLQENLMKLRKIVLIIKNYIYESIYQLYHLIFCF